MDIESASGDSGANCSAASGNVGRYAFAGGAVAAWRDAIGTGADGLGWVDVDPNPDAVPPLPALALNALLGGTDNFAEDRDLAAWSRLAWPGFESLMWAQSAFANRVVRWLVGQGIGQFLDIGCGLPVIGAVHDIAGADAKIVYADLDPMVVSYAQDLLGERSEVVVVKGDLRKPASILYADTVMARINFCEPVGVLLTGVLPFLTDGDDPAGIITQIRRAVVSGSYLAVSHLAPMPDIERSQRRLQFIYNDAHAPFEYRTAGQIADLLTAWELVEPGVVPVTDWRPGPTVDEQTPAKASLLGAVARASQRARSWNGVGLDRDPT